MNLKPVYKAIGAFGGAFLGALGAAAYASGGKLSVAAVGAAFAVALVATVTTYLSPANVPAAKA